MEQDWKNPALNKYHRIFFQNCSYKLNKISFWSYWSITPVYKNKHIPFKHQNWKNPIFKFILLCHEHCRTAILSSFWIKNESMYQTYPKQVNCTSRRWTLSCFDQSQIQLKLVFSRIRNLGMVWPRPPRALPSVRKRSFERKAIPKPLWFTCYCSENRNLPTKFQFWQSPFNLQQYEKLPWRKTLVLHGIGHLIFQQSLILKGWEGVYESTVVKSDRKSLLEYKFPGTKVLPAKYSSLFLLWMFEAVSIEQMCLIGEGLLELESFQHCILVNWNKKKPRILQNFDYFSPKRTEHR